VTTNFTQPTNNTDKNHVPLVPAPCNPMAVARQLMEERTLDGCRTLRRWRGGWMSYLGTRWAEIEATEVSAWLYEQLEHAEYLHLDPRTKTEEVRPWRPNRSKITNVLDTLTAVSHLPERVNTPSWQDGPALAAPGQLVACRNGLLDVSTRTLHPHTPTYFNLVAVPFDYHQHAPPPVRWLQFLRQLWPDDPNSITALRQYFGYVLSGRTDIHKIMLLVGPTRSGKGTIARVLESLVGEGNYQGPTLASLATNFGLAPLIGVPLAVVSDARLSAKDNTGQIVERLLSISGEDVLTIDRKYRECWTGKLPTRLLILSNELPRLGDASGAIANRFLILAMHNSFLGKEDIQLTGKLLVELPGILNWSLDGLQSLANTGSFTVPLSSDEAIIALHDLVSPISAFVRDRCEIGGQVVVDTLYRAWSRWATDNGHHVGSVHTFARDLRAVMPNLKVKQPRVNGIQVRHYAGVRLTSNDVTNRRPGTAA
jgi:putative DNA primase/helicase